MSCLAGVALERWSFNPGHKRSQQPPEGVVVDVAGDASNLATVVHHHESWRVAHRRNESDTGCRWRIDVDPAQWQHLGLVGLAITGADISMPPLTPDAAIALENQEFGRLRRRRPKQCRDHGKPN